MRPLHHFQVPSHSDLCRFKVTIRYVYFNQVKDASFFYLKGLLGIIRWISSKTVNTMY
jgi:hypothetical protein